MAARTAYEAVDAATSAAPLEHRRPASAGSRQDAGARVPNQRPSVHEVVRVAGRVGGSARAARQGMLAPVKRASQAVSLEIAGSFFALFALSFGVAAWRLRNVSTSDHGQRLWICVGVAVLFGYFALSSFLRAWRISRT